MRRDEVACALEGPDLVVAALARRGHLRTVFVDESRAETFALILTRCRDVGVEVIELADGVSDRISDARTSQGMLAVARSPLVALDVLSRDGTVVVAHEISDPGNLGAIIRSAQALGASGVVASGGGVDPTNPKCLRATAGAIFHVAVAAAGDLHDAFTAAHGRRTVALVARGGRLVDSGVLRGDVMLIVGNEGRGLSDVDVAQCDERATVPMTSGAESLNAAVAASIALYESTRRHRHLDVTSETNNIERP